LFLITPEQDLVYGVLEKTGCLTAEQALRILRASYDASNLDRALGVFNQLRHMQRLYLKPDNMAILPHLAQKPADADMLAAADVMLDLSNGKPLEISAKKPPFKLCFLAEHGEKIGSYGVVIVQPGEEDAANRALEETDTRRTVIFLLSESAQRPLLKTAQQHYFAIPDGDKYRYFKGNI
jgi:hypothetical protein